MSTAEYTPPVAVPVPVPHTHEPETRVDYLNVNFGVRSWLLTTDHKRIAIMYLIVITLMFFLGGAFAVLIRLELATPKSDLFEADTFNRLFTMHGIVMVFFFLIPAIPSTLGNFLVPLMIGAKDLAFPRLNLASWYVYLIGAALTLWGILSSGIDTGWTFYVPYSTKSAHTSVMPVAVGVLVLGFSSIMTALNFIVTIHTMRAPGMTWFRMPLFLWSTYATSIVIMLGTPVISITLILVAVERILGTGIFDRRLGGDPILFQHLFWFYSHPAVYIMILPAMGVISELITAFSRKTIFGYRFVAFASMAIAVFGFLVWGHHMFVSGMSPYAGMIFSLLSYIVSIPSAIKVFNWTATLFRGSVSWQTPMLYAIGFIGLFAIGGMTGLVLAAMPVDVHVTDTYFVVAHFHYIMVGGTILAYLGGLHYWWPKITGRMYPEGWAKAAALIIFVGFNLTFFPQFIVGYQGMPRRVAEYAPEFQVLNVMSTAGASILGFGFLLPFGYLFWSLRYAKAAGPNPFGATGLEWQTESPPPPHNFEVTPTVTLPPYQYRIAPESTEAA
ncbi:MAG: cytochrome c oxidase subunit I [Gemmataceae bacterium]